MSERKMLSLGDGARRLGVPLWKLRNLFIRGIVPDSERVGLYRVIYEDQLPGLESALRQVGYLPPTAGDDDGDSAAVEAGAVAHV